MKFKFYYLLVAFTCINALYSNAQKPIINQLSFPRGKPLSELTIHGKGFNKDKMQNSVSLGNIKATVLSADTDSLKIQVPFGPSNEKLIYANLSNNLGTASRVKFLSFPFTKKSSFSNNELLQITEITLSDGARKPYYADFNDDQYPDIVMGCADSKITIHINNTKSDGNISFANAITIPVKTTFNLITVADINYDGKQDIINAGTTNNNLTGIVTILINTSSGNQLTFSTYEIENQYAAWNLMTGDLNDDGKLDIIHLTNGPQLIIYENTSIGNNISFQKRHFRISEVMANCTIYDYNKDGKDDIISTRNQTDGLSIFINKSGQNIDFEQENIQLKGTTFNHVEFGNIDPSDQEDEMVCTDYLNPYIYIYKINKQDLSLTQVSKLRTPGANLSSLNLTDCDGDGLLDIVVGAWTSNSLFDIFLNKSLASNNFSFSNPISIDVSLSGDKKSRHVFPIDLNKDSRLDYYVLNSYYAGVNSKLTIFQSKKDPELLAKTKAYTDTLVYGDSSFRQIPLSIINARDSQLLIKSSSGVQLSLDSAYFNSNITSSLPKRDSISYKLYVKQLSNRNIGNYKDTIVFSSINLSDTVFIQSVITKRFAQLIFDTTKVFNKLYDGTDTVSYTGYFRLTKILNKDSSAIHLASMPTLHFIDSAAGRDKKILTKNIALSGPKANNYTITSIDIKRSISRKPLTMDSIQIESKVYDGTTTASVKGLTFLIGILPKDTIWKIKLVDSSFKFSFQDKTAGVNKPIAINGSFLLTSNVGNNYEVIKPSVLSADILKRKITISGLSAISKYYDGYTDVSLSGPITFTNTIPSDSLTVLIANLKASFTDAQIGQSKKVVVSNIILSGKDAANYITDSILELSADIYPLPQYGFTKDSIQLTSCINQASKVDSIKISIGFTRSQMKLTIPKSLELAFLRTGPFIKDSLMFSNYPNSKFDTTLYIRSTASNNNGLFADSISLSLPQFPVKTMLVRRKIISLQKPSIFQQSDTLISTIANNYQWFLNNVIIPGAYNQKYKLRNSGNYTVQIADSAVGCISVLSDVFSVLLTGISAQSTNNQEVRICAYPNPASTNQLSLELNKPLTYASRVEIISDKGITFKSSSFPIGTRLINLSIADIPKGVYVIVLYNEQNRRRISNTKFIKL